MKNQASIGYVIAAMKKRGFAQDTINQVIQELWYLTVTEAEHDAATIYQEYEL